MQEACVPLPQVQKAKEQKSKDMPGRNPQQAWRDSHVGVTCGLAQENVDSSAI